MLRRIQGRADAARHRAGRPAGDGRRHARSMACAGSPLLQNPGRRRRRLHRPTGRRIGRVDVDDVRAAANDQRRTTNDQRRTT